MHFFYFSHFVILILCFVFGEPSSGKISLSLFRFVDWFLVLVKFLLLFLWDLPG